MHRLRHSYAAVLVASLICFLTGCTTVGAEAPTPNGISASPRADGADCPEGPKCIVQIPKLADATSTGDGLCNYSPLGKATDQWHASGVVIHTTEGSAESALSEIQDPTQCLSWNYLITTDGTIYENVRPGNLVFSSGNRFFNTDYIQIEHAGYAAKCDITDAAYAASAKLVSYLSKRYGFTVTPSTVFGHDSVPPINDKTQANQPQHWDPGTCWNWNAYLKMAGATYPPAGSDSNAIQIAASFNGTKGKNFVPLYTKPSANSPLVSDPYVRGGKAGTTDPSDWSDKATVGHQYVVARRQGDWTGVWFGGHVAWFKGKGKAIHAKIVTPKSDNVPVYGRPMPSNDEFNASDIPATVLTTQNVTAQLTKYSLRAGQSYVLVSDTVKNQFFEGCDKKDCSGPFDGTLVTGTTKYVQIEWNHRYVFVKASDVNITG